MGEKQIKEDFVGWDEAISYAGISRNTILKRIKDSGFPAYKTGPRKYEFIISEIEQWKLQRKVTNV